MPGRGKRGQKKGEGKEGKGEGEEEGKESVEFDEKVKRSQVVKEEGKRRLLPSKKRFLPSESA